MMRPSKRSQSKAVNLTSCELIWLLHLSTVFICESQRGHGLGFQVEDTEYAFMNSTPTSCIGPQ